MVIAQFSKVATLNKALGIHSNLEVSNPNVYAA
jgi:hypothetical protein